MISTLKKNVLPTFLEMVFNGKNPYILCILITNCKQKSGLSNQGVNLFQDETITIN
jgi:hypothetical protein